MKMIRMLFSLAALLFLEAVRGGRGQSQVLTQIAGRREGSEWACPKSTDSG
jgi:hypothetical protein